MITRQDVYDAIDSEREYQENQKFIRANMKSLEMGEGIACIDVLLGEAKRHWYPDYEPYVDTTPWLRKIAAVCVDMMEQHGVANRDI
jgi:hypothetical protein